MSKSKIEWTDAVWNPVTGCTKVSDGCRNCYAERMSKRLAGRCGYPKDEPFKVTLHPDKLEQPLRWTKPRKIFVNSMSDLFHDDVNEKFIAKVFAIMDLARQHIYMILTKRPERAEKLLNDENFQFHIGWFQSQAERELGLSVKEIGPFPFKNVWIGVSVENQATADERIPLLLQIPAVVRFISAEPLLSEINLSRYLKWPICKRWGRDGDPNKYGEYHWEKQSLVGTDWVGIDLAIVGGESGPGARPMHPDWACSLRDQCQLSDTSFFFKQWGEWKSESHTNELSGFMCRDVFLNRNGTTTEPIDGWIRLCRVGKKQAGRELDGRT